MVAADPRTARGRAQRRGRAARRRRLRAVRLLRLRHRHADLRPPRRRRPALRELPHHRAVLADPGLPAHAAATTTPTAWPASSSWPPASPGYNATIPKENGFLSEILRDEGYATFAVGKWHLSPATEMAHGHRRATSGRSAAASSATTASWAARPTSTTPTSCTTTTPSTRPARPRRGTTSPRTWPTKRCSTSRTCARPRPNKPFFLWFTPGACHAPHQAPAGVHRALPRPVRRRAGTSGATGCSPTPARLRSAAPGHASCPSARRGCRRGTRSAPTSSTLYARMMEVYAGFLTHTDAQVRACSTSSRTIGELDNTIVIVMSDNGASAEGGAKGSFNEQYFFNFVPESLEENLAPHRRPRHAPRQQPLPVGLGVGGQHAAQAVQARHPRGRRGRPVDRPLAGPASARPARPRHQYVHAIDLMPTLLDADRHRAAGGDQAASSRRRSRARASRRRSSTPTAPNTHVTQYYEMLGSPGAVPRRLEGGRVPPVACSSPTTAPT